MNKRIIGICILFIILIIGTISLFEDNANISINTNGINSITTVTAIPIIHSNIKEMENQINDYVLSQESANETMTINQLKSNIVEIAKSYNYTNIDIHFQSQFGEDKIPMLVTVSGTSMVPTLNDGDQIIVEKTKNISVGNMVIAKDDQFGKIVKRIGAIKGNEVYLKSDNTQVTYQTINGSVYKTEGLKKWTKSSNIIGIVKEYPNQNKINAN